jgi:hypothetical protein
VVREGVGAGGRMTHALYAHRNNKRKKKKKRGFTKSNGDELEHMVAKKQLIPHGCEVKYTPNRGPLDK